jgi:hypothetical protein
MSELAILAVCPFIVPFIVLFIVQYQTSVVR